MKQSNIVHLKTSILLVKTSHHNTQLNFKINSAIGQILSVLWNENFEEKNQESKHGSKNSNNKRNQFKEKSMEWNVKLKQKKVDCDSWSNSNKFQ